MYQLSIILDINDLKHNHLVDGLFVVVDEFIGDKN